MKLNDYSGLHLNWRKEMLSLYFSMFSFSSTEFDRMLATSTLNLSPCKYYYFRELRVSSIYSELLRKTFVKEENHTRILWVGTWTTTYLGCKVHVKEVEVASERGQDALGGAFVPLPVPWAAPSGVAKERMLFLLWVFKQDCHGPHIQCWCLTWGSIKVSHACNCV